MMPEAVSAMRGGGLPSAFPGVIDLSAMPQLVHVDEPGVLPPERETCRKPAMTGFLSVTPHRLTDMFTPSQHHLTDIEYRPFHAHALVIQPLRRVYATDAGGAGAEAAAHPLFHKKPGKEGRSRRLPF